MEKRKLKRLLAVCSIVMLLICAIPTVSASVNSYTGKLPSYQTFATLTTGIKESPNTKQAQHTITSTSFGYFKIMSFSTGKEVASETRCHTGVNVIPYQVLTPDTVILQGRAEPWSIKEFEIAGVINFS